MSAGKLADLYGCFPGHVIETADGDQAYPQAKMASSTRTWVRLPRDRWPEWWTDPSAPQEPMPDGTMPENPPPSAVSRSPYRDPVVEMKQALYGHPDAGGYWERHCDAWG